MGWHVTRAHALFLAARNEVLQLFGRKALIVHVVLFAQALDRRELVLRIQNLERLRQTRCLVVRAQQAGCTGRGRCQSTCRAR